MFKCVSSMRIWVLRKMTTRLLISNTWYSNKHNSLNSDEWINERMNETAKAETKNLQTMTYRPNLSCNLVLNSLETRNGFYVFKLFLKIKSMTIFHDRKNYKKSIFQCPWVRFIFKNVYLFKYFLWLLLCCNDRVE